MNTKDQKHLEEMEAELKMRRLESRLADLEPPEVGGSLARQTVFRLAPTILEKNEAGLTVDEIYEALKDDLDISKPTFRRYYYQARKRLLDDEADDDSGGNDDGKSEDNGQPG